MTWGMSFLGDIAYEVRDLYEPLQNETLPYVGLEHIEQETLRLSGIGKSNMTVSTKKKFLKGDILFGSLRPYFRKVVRPKFDGVCSTDITVIRACDGYEIGFLYYLVASKPFIQHATNISSGTRMPRANWGVLSNSKWPVPPLSTQRKIAAILSAYDDLIEDNTRRIQILEEMAQTLYRHWVVDYKFPGHKNVRMVDSGTELGKVPEGWEVKPVGGLLEYYIGGGWGKVSPDEKHIIPAYVIRGTDIPGARKIIINDCPLRIHTESNLKKRILLPNDIVFEVSGGSVDQPVGRALFVGQHLLDMFDKPVMCASFCKLVRVNDEKLNPHMMYLHFLKIYDNRVIEKYQVQSTGIKNFKFTYFLEEELVIVPPKEIQHAFNKIVAPVFELIGSLGTKNSNLRATRDLLLPRLVSGEVDVSELDINM